MEKAPQNEPKKGGLTKAAVVLAAGMMLPNMGEKVASAENHIKEDDGKKITVMASENQTVHSESTVVYDPNVYTKQEASGKDEQKEISETEPIPEEDVSISNEAPVATASSPSVNSEKEVVKAEVAPPSIELDEKAFTEHIKILLKSILGEETILEKINIKGSGELFLIEAEIKGKNFEAGFTGNLKSTMGELSMENTKIIKGGFLVKLFAKNELGKNIKDVLSQLKTRLGETYKTLNPDGIKNLLIEGGKLKIIFNKNS